jgi:hypothetical protein
MRNIMLVICLAFLTTSCSLYTSDSVDSGLDYYPEKKSYEDVQYLETMSQPHQVIGQAKVNAERNQKHSNVIRQLRETAAAMGGDAITNVTVNRAPQTLKIKRFENSYIRAIYSADVVILK